MPQVPLHPLLKPFDLSIHIFKPSEKRIHSQADLDHFNVSPAYNRIVAFLNHLNASVSPLAISSLQQEAAGESTFSMPAISPEKVYTNSPTIQVSQPVQQIVDLIQELEQFIAECPPDTGPRRFGNVAFRTWHKVAEERIPELLDKHLSTEIICHKPTTGISAKAEVTTYLMGSFGSAQRLDYGTGHELSFLAFLCAIWLLGSFIPGRDEQAIVLRVIPTYLHLIRTLVKTYTLEPAGSHGVWGLDDHSFLPYIFGSAQLTTQAPQPGVEPDYRKTKVPKPGDVAKPMIVDEWREKNLYFGAIGFINDVKKGPFWEHSPILFDISGVKEGWGKINIGMIKMYKAEVLGKFPVVQHFPFGSIFPWTSGLDDSNASNPNLENIPDTTGTSTPHPQVTTRAPWAKQPLAPTFDKPITSSQQDGRGVIDLVAGTKAPWTRAPAAPGAAQDAGMPEGGVIAKAPWAK
ncbi:Phosphotyrosyl phosphate activator protein-domain-containing protein [Kalaharituber pfeilii]|nr:Phosphotyrosyl phosphate activator protein-domain-containing protein [Kalaharituber pfeilii]